MESVPRPPGQIKASSMKNLKTMLRSQISLRGFGWSNQELLTPFACQDTAVESSALMDALQAGEGVPVGLMQMP